MYKSKHHSGGTVRKSASVGPDYPEQLYRLPWGTSHADDHWSGDETSKTLHSPNGLTTTPDIPVHENGYNKIWEGE